MNILDFFLLQDNPITEEELKNFLEINKDGFILRWMVDLNTQAYSDITFNYIEAAFVGQECLKYADRISFDFRYGIHNYPVADFVLRPKDIPAFAFFLSELLVSLTGDDANSAFSHSEDIAQFEEDINKIDVGFPELLDDYFANLVNGVYHEIASDTDEDEVENQVFLENEFATFPERQFGFWQVASAEMVDKFYASTQAWIIPDTTSLELILKKHSGIGRINFEKANLFTINHISYLISKGLLLHFPFDIFLKAKACAYSAILRPRILEKNDWMDSLFTFTRIQSYWNAPETAANDEYHELLESESLGYIKKLQKPEFFISEFGDQVLVRDGDFDYLIWQGDQPKFNELLVLNQKISEIFAVSAQLAGIISKIDLPWEQLNDERFEQLCVDVLFYNPSFNPDTIRKMGKSRSRDSGRDIEIWTHSRPNYKAEKFIFQCKFLKPGTSLTATKMLDISDIVDQFGAAGYGVMTNVVIDPTLYDKLDRLAANKKIRVDDYSVYKLERVLARYPALVYRHFKK